MSTTTDLTTLKINYLTQAQYDAAVEGGTINENEIYMTPAEDEFAGMLQIKRASGSFIEVADCARLPVQSLIANITATQSGSGDPSPSNVRTISGFDSVNVTRTGKNLLDPNTAAFSTATSSGVTFTIADGVLTVSGTATSAINRAMFASIVLPKGTYVFTSEGGTTNSYLYLKKDTDSNWYRSGNSFSIDGTETSVRILLYTPSGESFNTTFKPMICSAPLSDSTYEPYQSTTYAVSLGRTVYGGNLDVITGILTATHGYIASYAGETLPSTWISDRDVYASGTTPTTGAQVVYTLASSQTYKLSSTDISMLLGTNNVWADSGDIELSYIAAN